MNNSKLQWLPIIASAAFAHACANDDAGMQPAAAPAASTVDMSMAPPANNDALFQDPTPPAETQPPVDPGPAPASVDACDAAGAAMPGPGAEAHEAISISGAWAPLDGNSVGIQGALYSFADMGGSSVDPMPKACGAEVCLAGVAGQVIGGEFGTTWGAAMGMTLFQEEGSSTQVPYDAQANGVTGFGFWITGLPPNNIMRFQVDDANGGYCADLKEGWNEFTFDQLNFDCWMPEPSGVHPDPTQLLALDWFISTREEAAQDFNFCVSNLTALTGGAVAGDAGVVVEPVGDAGVTPPPGDAGAE